MPLQWAIESSSATLVVTGRGPVTARHVKAFLSELKGQPEDTFGKIILLEGGRLTLDHEELDQVAAYIRAYCAKEAPGPIALVVTDPFNLDMAVLLKQRLPSAKFRIFGDPAPALNWILHPVAVAASDRAAPGAHP